MVLYTVLHFSRSRTLCKVGFKTLRSCRYLHETVRVRFAPSPTGSLHLGGLRTALYNYAFAKSQGGVFILRIEDTDQTRLVPGARHQLEDVLSWSGIVPDEGPSSGGDFGPYIQSQRLDLYRKSAEQLTQDGSAYYCFCSDKQRELLQRHSQRVSQLSPPDHRCLNLHPGEVEDMLNRNLSHCIRFHLQREPVLFTDLVYGPLTMNVGLSESDIVLIKTDGYPTYHFANVVDDHYMNITHVLRGKEWQASTRNHCLLYKAFGWELPKFGHLPLIVNSDGTKLSKRQGDTDVNHFRSLGYTAQSLLNFLTDIGKGFNKDDQSYSLHELVTKFSLADVQKTSSQLNLVNLNKAGQAHLCKLLSSVESRQQLVKDLQLLVVNNYGQNIDIGVRNIVLSSEYITRILNGYSTYVSRISELVSPENSFLWIPPDFVDDSLRVSKAEEIITATIELVSNQPSEELDRQQLNDCLKDLAPRLGLKYFSLMKILRAYLTGDLTGPGVSELFSLMGKMMLLHRLRHALTLAKGEVIDRRKVEQ